MMRASDCSSHSHCHGPRLVALAITSLLFLTQPFHATAADSAVQVQLDANKASPRAVESMTGNGIVRDYRGAWTRLAQALESNTMDSLDGPFTGDARRVLGDTVASQQKSGLRQRYLDQSHKLEAVFYAPEGDVIELHDTAEYQLQVLDGDKIIQNEHVTLHYVVLMTPSADRWMVRNLQTVPQF
jgi:hypothetical protein